MPADDGQRRDPDQRGDAVRVLKGGGAVTAIAGEAILHCKI
jgi:hypothetical protein